MPYGMQILQDNGNLWLSPDFTPLNLLTKITQSVSVGTVFVTNIPSSNQAIFFVSFDAVGVVVFEETITNGYRSLTVVQVAGVSSVTVYAFGNMATRNSDYGIFMFDSAGSLIFSADMRPLQMQSVGISVAGEGTIVDMGQPVAVLPTFSGRTSMPNSSVGGFNIFNYYTGAVGNSVINRRLQIGIGSGSAGFAFNTNAFFIYTNLYN